ncbi:MAG: glycosyltransferase, partial [Myxococcota bacterium]
MSRKVLYVIIALGFGGAEVQVVELAAAMRRRGWDPLLVGLAKPLGLEGRARELGVAFTDLGFTEGSRDPRMIPRLVRVVRRFGPDVLHTHTLPANFVGRAARPLCRVPVMVTSAHNVFEGGRAKMAYYRATDRLTDLTTNVSPEAVERYVKIGAVPSADRIRYVPNGMDLDRFAPDPDVRARTRAELGLTDETFLWLAVGRHMEQKDYPNLLDALVGLRDRPRWQVAIVGTGPLLDATVAGVRERRLEDRVRVLGLRTDVADLMKAADGYVMSSAWEGLPIVLLEAGASALPLVATDVGGNREVVTDGAGHLVPPRDAPALARAMREVMDAPQDARRATGARARARVAGSFGMDAVSATWDG